MGARCDVKLLGGLQVTTAERVLNRFQTRKTGALLAYLAYDPQRSHPRELLTAILWPEDEPGSARHKLSMALSSLRRQLEPPGVAAGTVILADRQAVQLNPAIVTTDVAEFEARLAEAAEADSRIERAQLLAEAAALYRGVLLPAYFEEWIIPERRRLVERYLRALSQLAADLELLGDLSRALGYARRAVAVDPLREEAHHDLLRLLEAAGQPEAALCQYQEFERALASQLGLAPGAATRELAEAIRRRRSAVSRKPAQPALPVPSRSAAPTALPTGTITLLLAHLHCPGGKTPSPLQRDALLPVSERAPLLHAAGSGPHSSLEPGTDRAPVRSLFRGAGGHEISAGSDTVLLAFGRATDALAAALAACRGEGPPNLAAAPRPTAHPDNLRLALHTGELVPDEPIHSSRLFEQTVRLLRAARLGQILVSQESAGLLEAALPPDVRLVELGLYWLREEAPRRLFTVQAAGLTPAAASRPRAQAAPGGHVPAPRTRFFGRERELERLQELLLMRERRLLTLIGPGGSGKTRLALELAARLREAFQGAVWFASLADVAEPRLIPEKLLDAMLLPRSSPIPPLEQAAAVFARQPSLLLLDNIEQLLTPPNEEAALAVIEALLEQASSLTLLVTSRQRLHLPGEREFPVLPLPVPKSVDSGQWLVVSPTVPTRTDSTTIHYPLTTVPSVALFVDRAQAVRPDFQLTAANAAATAELCARLEGMPLALELAAARIGAFTPAEMLVRLDQRFELLATRARGIPLRYRSLEASLDWSYQLLVPELQQFFARLSLFRGGFTLAAAAEVAGSAAEPGNEDPASRALEQLRECSLLFSELVVPAPPAGPATLAGGGDDDACLDARTHQTTRYRLLETIREYGARQLTRADRADRARRHAEFYLALAEQAEPGFHGPEAIVWLDQLEAEHDNLRAALDWAVETGAAETGMRLAWALLWFWLLRNHMKEGRRQWERLLALPGHVRPLTRARALLAAGNLAHHQGDYRTAGACYQSSLAIAREQEDALTTACLLNSLGLLAQAEGDFARAEPLYRESLALRRQTGVLWEIAWSLNNLGMIAFLRQDEAAAEALLRESLALRRAAGDRWGLAWSLNDLGLLAMRRHRLEEAEAYFQECLLTRRAMNDTPGMSSALHVLGTLASRQRRFQQAQALHRQGLTLQRDIGDRDVIARCLEGLAAATSSADEGPQGAQRLARLLGAAAALRTSVRAPLPPHHRADYEVALAAARGALGETAFAAAWTSGEAMGVDEAIAYALLETAAGAPTLNPRSGFPALESF